MGQEHKEYTWNLIAKKLSGEASPEELAELENLLRSNPELHYPMQTVADLWNVSNPIDQQEAVTAFNRHLDRMQELNLDFVTHGTDNSAPDPIDTIYPSNRRRIFKRRLALTGSVLLATLTAAVIWLYPRSARTPVNGKTAMLTGKAGGEIFTSNGSRTHLVLPDGTTVWLNAGSRIKYDPSFDATLREVQLSGEAFFDVARNPEKPFVIHTARIDIKVLGTRFNVKSYPLDKTTETTLIKGSIEVSIKDRPTEKIILKPNEKLVVANDDSILHHKTPAGNPSKSEGPLVAICKPTYESRTGAVIETSWVDNKLIFQDEEFRELARRMERWYGVTIGFNNPRQEELHFTGSFQHETIQQALDALMLTANFKYTIRDNQITVYDK